MHGIAIQCVSSSDKTFFTECCNNFDRVWEKKFRLLRERQHKGTFCTTTPLKPPVFSLLHTFLLIYPLVLEWPVSSFSNPPNRLALLDSKAIWKTRSLLEMHKLHLLNQNSCLESDSQKCLSQNRGMYLTVLSPLFLSPVEIHWSTHYILNTDSTRYSYGPLSSCRIAMRSWFEIREENVERRKWGWVASLHVWLELIQNQIYERQLLRAWRTDECRDSCVAAAAAQRTARLCVSAQYSSKGKQRFHFSLLLSLNIAIKYCYIAWFGLCDNALLKMILVLDFFSEDL